MYINCPNGCQNAYLKKMFIGVNVSQTVNLDYDNRLMTQYLELEKEPEHGYYCCDECGHNFGELSIEEVVRLLDS